MGEIDEHREEMVQWTQNRLYFRRRLFYVI